MAEEVKKFESKYTSEEIEGKLDKVNQEFTSEEKEKLTTLNNYNDTDIQQRITELENNKANKSDVYNKTETNNVITAKVAEIVAGAPEEFDTLKEMSDWLTDHSGSAAEMNTAIQTNTKAIADNATAIEDNTADIESNKSDILNMKSNMLISSSKAVSEPNWYRVFSITPKGTSRTGLIMINRNFSNNSPENYLLSFSLGYNLNEFNLIKRLNDDSVQLIDNIRVVYANSSPNAKECYIDIHYVSNSSNPVYTSMLFGTGADCNIVPVNYTIAEVPEGYTSKEFSLATNDIFKRITALETALSQTTTVSE